MKTSKFRIFMKMIVPFMFVGMILMHACYFFYTGKKFPESAMTNRDFIQIAMPVWFTGLLIVMMLIHICILQFKVSKIEDALKDELRNKNSSDTEV